MSAKCPGQWVRSDFEDDGEVLFFFHPPGGGGGEAYLVMYADGSVEFSGDRKIFIERHGKKVKIENATDLVV